MSTSITITANTTQAQSSIARLQTASQKLNNTFGGLKTALGAVAFGAAIRSSLSFAAAVNDTSTATNVARQSILGLGQALTTNGGEARAASDAVQRFSLTLGQAAQGSANLQTAFSQVGVSLQDLASLDESEILARTIEGLGRIDDAGRRAAIQAQIFGRTMQGVNAAGLARDFRRLAGEQDRNADAIRKAGEAQDKLNAAMNRFQLAVVRTIEPLVDAFNRLSDQQIAKLIDGVVQLAAAVAALAVAVRVVTALGAAFTALTAVTAGYVVLARGGFAGLATTLAAASVRVTGFLRAFAAAPGVVGKLTAVFTTLNIHLSKTLPFAITNTLKLIPIVGILVARYEKLAVAVLGLGGKLVVLAAAVVGINAAIRTAFDTDPIDIMATKLENLVTSRFPGLAAAINKVGTALGMAPRPSAVTQPSMKVDPGIQNAVRSQQLMIANRTIINQQLDQETQKIQAAVREYQQLGAAGLKNLEFETSLLNKSEQQVAVLRARRDEQQRASAALQKLQQQHSDITQQMQQQKISQELGAGLLAEITAAQSQIRASSQAIADSAAQATAQYQQGLRARENELQITQSILDQQQQMVDHNRDIAAFQDQVNAARISAVDQVSRLQQENALTQQRAELELAIRSLRGEDQTAARAIFDLEQQRVQQLQAIRAIQDLPFQDRVRREREINDEIDRGRTVIEQRVLAMREEQNSFSSGWATAMQQFNNSIQTQAQIAGEIFGKVTRGMEDAFVNFAKTGKLSFRDLFKTIVETILRSQVQQLMARAFGGGGGGGGVLGSLFSAFLGGGSRSAGGPVSAGRAFRVGESGPETFVPTGSGTIVPGAGGATSVTYNINAVDASSFRSLVAQDPEFLFAVTEQGRRRMPNNRR